MDRKRNSLVGIIYENVRSDDLFGSKYSPKNALGWFRSTTIEPHHGGSRCTGAGTTLVAISLSSFEDTGFQTSNPPPSSSFDIIHIKVDVEN